MITLIKAEIERLKAKYRKDMYKSNYEGFASGYKIEAYNELLSFLDTLESEKPSGGLEEEIDKYREEHLFDMPAFQQVARHFAQWGADHTPLPEDTVLFNKGVEEGKRLIMEEAVNERWDELQTIFRGINEAFETGKKEQKQQMMKEAVEAEVESFSDMHPEVSVPLNPTVFKAGDKVRIIIVKEDEK